MTCKVILLGPNFYSEASPGPGLKPTELSIPLSREEIMLAERF